MAEKFNNFFSTDNHQSDAMQISAESDGSCIECGERPGNCNCRQESICPVCRTENCTCHPEEYEEGNEEEIEKEVENEIEDESLHGYIDYASKPDFGPDGLCNKCFETEEECRCFFDSDEIFDLTELQLNTVKKDKLRLGDRKFNRRIRIDT